MSLSDVFSLIAAAQGGFLAFLLKRFPGTASNNLLVMLLVAISLCLCTDVWVLTPFVYQYPQTSQILTPCYFALGPLLFLYVKKALQATSPNRFPQALHFLPTALFYLLIVIIGFVVSTEDLRKYLLEDQQSKSIDGFGVAIQLHIGFYLFASFITWRKFERAVKEEYSLDITLTMLWLKKALVIFSVMWGIWILGDFLDPSLTVATDFAMVIGVYFLGYSALLHKNIVLPTLKLASTEETPNNNHPPAQKSAPSHSNRYARAKLSVERIAQLKQTLGEIISRDHPYLEPELTLSQLAENVQATNHELSQLLNEELGENFFDFINRHRILEVQRCLHDSAYNQQTILDIALASGFNSKAAFNAAFKKVTGMTPTQYKSLQP